MLVRNAYLAGTFVALGCGVCGWFVVLRGQVFAGDALAHVALVGALGAALLGLDVRLGLFALTLSVAGLLAAGPRPAGDVSIGIALSWVSGIGILLITLLSQSSRGAQASTTVRALFGSIFSLDAAAANTAASISLLVAGAVLLIARPLLSATLDPVRAALAGVPVRPLGVAFLVALGAITAESAQAVGALLLLGLLAAPAGAAHRLTSRPYLGIALSAAIATGATWGGLAVSLAIPKLPPSSAIIGLAALAYGASVLSVRRLTSL